MAFLSKDAILTAKDLPFEDVDVQEWGGTVRVAGLTGKAASDFSAKLVSVDSKGKVTNLNMDNFLAELLALTIVDENMQPMFTQADVEGLGKKSAAVLKRLGDVASRLSGLSESALKDAEKN